MKPASKKAWISPTAYSRGAGGALFLRRGVRHADGRTNILHLNAIGETACTGYHGANRLASTSLLEAVATGYLCAAADAADIARDTFRLPEPKEWVVPDKQPDLNLIKQDLATLKSTMWNYVGLGAQRHAFKPR